MDDVNVVNSQETYPNSPLRIGDVNQHVLNMKMSLNTISSNYTAIPKVTPLDSQFNESLEAAVREFQNIFYLPVTGIVDKATWYEIRKVYTAVRKLAEHSASGSLIRDIPTDIVPVEVVPRVQLIQYFLNVLSVYYDSIPAVDINGILESETRAALIEYQKTVGLPTSGVIDQKTRETMYNRVLGILRELPPTAIALPALIYPNIIFMEGSEGPGVFVIQELLAFISTVVREIPTVEIDGIFGPETSASLIAFQRLYGLEADGIVDEETWNEIIRVYRELRFGENRPPGLFPITDIR